MPGRPRRSLFSRRFPAAVGVAAVVSGEPIFQPGVSTSLYYDGFESYADTAALKAAYVTDESGGVIALATTGAEAGSQAARFTYNPGSTQENVLIEKIGTQASDPNVVILTYWMRTQPGYVWASGVGVGGQGHKLFVGNVDGVGHTPEDRILLQEDFAGVDPPELASAYPDLVFHPKLTWSIGANLFIQNMNFDKWRVDSTYDSNGSGAGTVRGNDGTWQRYTHRFTKSTTLFTNGSGRGRIEVWVNGFKTHEFIGDDSGRPEFDLVNVPGPANGVLFPNLHFPSVNGSVGDQWLEFDELRLWTP